MSAQLDRMRETGRTAVATAKTLAQQKLLRKYYSEDALHSRIALLQSPEVSGTSRPLTLPAFPHRASRTPTSLRRASHTVPHALPLHYAGPHTLAHTVPPALPQQFVHPLLTVACVCAIQVVAVLERIWEVSDMDKSAFIERDEYLTMHRKLTLALDPSVSPAAAFASAADDWRADSEGRRRVRPKGRERG